MYPILVKIGPIPIYTYGFLIAVGFLTAVGVFKRLAIRSKLDVERIWILLSGTARRVYRCETSFRDYPLQQLHGKSHRHLQSSGGRPGFYGRPDGNYSIHYLVCQKTQDAGLENAGCFLHQAW